MANASCGTHVRQIGEADLKFRHWAKQLAMPMSADAIDGDFVPIALASGCIKSYL